MKKIYPLLLLAVAAITTSCQEEYTIEVPYSVGISSWYSTNLYDLTLVDNYIKSLGLPSTYITFTGHGNSESRAMSDADARAKIVVEDWIAKFNKDDIEALGLASNTRFAWSVSRYEKNNQGVRIVIGEFVWGVYPSNN